MTSQLEGARHRIEDPLRGQAAGDGDAFLIAGISLTKKRVFR